MRARGDAAARRRRPLLLVRAVVAVVAAAAAVVPTAWAGTECFYDSKSGAKFDLSPLVRSGDEPSFLAQGTDIPCTPAVEQNYSYVFNLCRDVSGDLPTGCSSSAAALQVDKRIVADPSDDWCFVAGRYDDTSKFTLLNSQDPSEGIQLQYTGDNCHHDRDGNNVPTPRKFKLQLTCEDKLNAVATHAYEYDHCEYTVSMPSVYGCPVECPIADRHLCGGNGHCGYDTDRRKSMCFCDDGWYGEDCTDKSEDSGSSGYSPALLGLIITLFIVTVFLVGGVLYMVRQVRAFQEDATNYMALKGSEEEAGV